MKHIKWVILREFYVAGVKKSTDNLQVGGSVLVVCALGFYRSYVLCPITGRTQKDADILLLGKPR
jgi:hypothetical protein